MQVGRRTLLGFAAASLLTRRAFADAPIIRVEEPKVGGTRLYSVPYVVYRPAWFAPRDGKADIVVHFHGGSQLQEENFVTAQLNAVVVSINLGVTSGAYSSFARAGEPVFKTILEKTLSTLAMGGTPTLSAGRVALSAWSAGFGALRPLLQSAAVRDRVDAVLIADGMFSAFVNPQLRTIHTDGLSGTFAFARAAVARQRLFVCTHTAIPTVEYASVAETTKALLDDLGVPKKSLLGDPRQPSYEAKRGLFTALGYAGANKEAHIDQIKFMGENMFKPLRERWNKPVATTLAQTGMSLDTVP